MKRYEAKKAKNTLTDIRHAAFLGLIGGGLCAIKSDKPVLETVGIVTYLVGTVSYFTLLGADYMAEYLIDSIPD